MELLSLQCCNNLLQPPERGICLGCRDGWQTWHCVGFEEIGGAGVPVDPPCNMQGKEAIIQPAWLVPCEQCQTPCMLLPQDWGLTSGAGRGHYTTFTAVRAGDSNRTSTGGAVEGRGRVKQRELANQTLGAGGGVASSTYWRQGCHKRWSTPPAGMKEDRGAKSLSLQRRPSGKWEERLQCWVRPGTRGREGAGDGGIRR